jgi:hypothetical protein
MHEGSREHALIAVSPGENSPVIEGILSFGILWLDWAREHTDKRAVEGLRVFVPEETSRFIRERALGLSASVRLEVFEYNERESALRQMDPAERAICKAALPRKRMRRRHSPWPATRWPTSVRLRRLTPN